MSMFGDFDLNDIINAPIDDETPVIDEVPSFDRDGWYGPMIAPYGNGTVFTCYEYAPKSIVRGIIYQSNRHTYAVENDRWVVKGWDERDCTVYEVNVYGKLNAAKSLEKFCQRQDKAEVDTSD